MGRRVLLSLHCLRYGKLTSRSGDFVHRYNLYLLLLEFANPSGLSECAGIIDELQVSTSY